VLERLTGELLDAEAVAGALVDPPASAGCHGGLGPARMRAEDPLLELEPRAYVEVSCPFHDDPTPSLHVYETPAGGWYCYGCRRGTSVYDLAAPLWGLETRGADFLELRRRLYELLLPGQAPARSARMLERAH